MQPAEFHATYVSNWALQYAYSNTMNWNTQTIDPDAQVIHHALAVDDLGIPHVAYIALYPLATTGELRYATLSNSHWLTTTVDPSPYYEGGNGCAVSIAVDANRHPHISYGVLPTLSYAVLSGTEWVRQTRGQRSWLGDVQQSRYRA